MTKAQHEAVDSGFIDLNTLDQGDYEQVKLNDIENTLVQVAAAYVDLLHQKALEKDVNSSGSMIDSINATQVTKTNQGYSIGITAPDYASYQDEGVNGWKVDRGSRFQFRTKGVDPGGAMVASVKQWIQREGSSARNVKKSISKREQRGKQMKDATTQAAVSASYFIKKKGIKPTHFWRDATNEINDYIESELAIATKIDIINNLYP